MTAGAASAQGPADAAALTLAEIHVYPVKGLRGIALTEGETTASGLRHDRRWMVVDAQGEFVTQRSHPRMARVSTAIEGDSLVLRANGMDALALPLSLHEGEAAPRRVLCWEDACDALAGGAEAQQWITEALAEPMELVYLPERSLRAVDPEHARRGERVGFADAYPYLLVCTASIDALNAQLGAPVGADRFRANFVIAGGVAWQEDAWDVLSVGAGDVRFRVATPCVRCAVVNVDQATGATSKQPLATLRAVRMINKRIVFGQNLVCEREGTVRVGDRVAATTRG